MTGDGLGRALTKLPYGGAVGGKSLAEPVKNQL